MVYQRMSLPAGINRRHALLAGFLLSAVWLWVAMDRPAPEVARVWNPYSSKDPPLVDVRKDVFDFPPLKSWVIQDVCETTEWNSDLVFVSFPELGHWELLESSQHSLQLSRLRHDRHAITTTVE